MWTWADTTLVQTTTNSCLVIDLISYLVFPDPLWHAYHPFSHSLQFGNQIMSLSCVSLHPLRSIWQNRIRRACLLVGGQGERAEQDGENLQTEIQAWSLRRRLVGRVSDCSAGLRKFLAAWWGVRESKLPCVMCCENESALLSLCQQKNNQSI